MLQLFRAPADLAPWIDGAVLIRLGPGPGVSRFPALPHAMLTMRLAGPAAGGGLTLTLCPPITFHTLSTEPMAHTHAGPLTAMGLLVRPEAAACLLGDACGAIVNQVLPWAAVAGAAEAAWLDDAVDQARDDAARLGALLASFRRAVQPVARGRDQAYARLCTAVGAQGALAGDQLGLGRRQLERRCQAVLGVSPKQFQRMVRFRQALSMAVTGGAARLTAVALDAGFYDQSHLARDARRLAGAPLGQLIAAARPDSPWWPLAARAGPSPGPLTTAWPGR
ncbi:MAG: AraC family transcriptional regulator [Betaproteobacteria bacterium]|jgi:AraC-like DNA-binding protein|nr:AraC family transcriptional regulator [Betaproteobacteria bacterium]